MPILIGAAPECGLQPSGGVRVCSIAQVEPFQRSARVAAWLLPTATQAVADAHDTLAGRTRGSSPGATGGTGSRWIVHLLPSQCSAMPKMPPLQVPTAMQFAAVAQDTAVSAEYPMWPMSWVRWTVHRVPFHRSVSVLSR